MGISREHTNKRRDKSRWKEIGSSRERAYQHEERQVEIGGDGNQQRDSMPIQGEVGRDGRIWKSVERTYQHEER